MVALHHKVNVAILGLAPICFFFSPSFLQTPFDLLVGLALPMHGHIGMNLVATDYVGKLFGKGAVQPFRIGLAGSHMV